MSPPHAQVQMAPVTRLYRINSLVIQNSIYSACTHAIGSFIRLNAVVSDRVAAETHRKPVKLFCTSSDTATQVFEDVFMQTLILIKLLL